MIIEKSFKVYLLIESESIRKKNCRYIRIRIDTEIAIPNFCFDL